jgi:CubicO group peptidase (beta-lactamase class C family)
VHTYVSNWPSAGQKGNVTIEHLLSNRGGIKQYADFNRSDSYRPGRYTDQRSDFNASQSVSVFRQAALFSNPGDSYHYSSFGFNLLGAAIDDAADGGYVGWIEKNVAEPLGMRSLAPKTSTFRGYKRDCAGVPQLRTTGDDRWKLPGGGWSSNVGDLLRFANGIVSNRLLRTTSTLWTNVPGNNRYGYGINHAGSGSELRVWHGGSHANARSLLYLFPDDRTAVVILSNTGHLNTLRLLHHVAAEIGKDWWNDPTTPVVQCNGDDDDCGGRGRYTGVWRRTGSARAEGVVVRRGYSHDAFGAAWRLLRADGYVATDIEAHTEGGSLRWDGVFQKESGSQAMWRNFSQDAFNRKWRQETARGMHLVDLETYTIRGRRYWAGIFRPGSGRTALYRNLSTDAFGERRTELQRQGFRLIDVEAYTTGGSLRWAGVWDQGPKDVLNRNYSTDAFGDLRERRRRQGYRLVDVESYRVNGSLKWAGIWERDGNAEKLNRRWDEYCRLMNERFVPYRTSGYELIDLERE